MTLDALNAIALDDVVAPISHPAASADELALLQWAADHPIDRPTLPINGRRQYQAAPPTGGKAKGHTRASTFADALSDPAGLTTWRHRLLVRGLVSTDDLVTAARAAGDDGKALSSVVGTALHVAGEKLAADIGTALHTAIEHALMGSGEIPPAPYDIDVAAVTGALDAHRTTVAATHLEWTLYVPGDALGPGHGAVIGRCDALATAPCCDRLHVLDWKSGKDARRLAYAVQTGTYARATHRWDDGWVEVPPICDQRAYLVQIPAGTGVASVIEVDLQAAAPLVALAAEVRQARSTTTLGRLFSDAPTMAVAEALEATLAAQDAGASDDPPVAPGQGEGAGDTPSPIDVDQRRRWLQDRFAAVATIDGAREHAGRHWPTDVPTTPAEWQDHHIDALLPLIEQIESLGGAQFPPTDPTRPDPAQALAAAMAPAEAPPALERRGGEGDWCERSDVDDLLACVKAMADGPRHLADGWNQQANVAGLRATTHADGRWSQRCLAVNVAMYELAVTFGDEDPQDTDTVVRHLLATVIGDDLQGSWSTGAVVASLSIDEATRLAAIAAAYGDGDTEAAATVAAAFTRAA